MPSSAQPASAGPWRLGPRGQRWFDRILVVSLLLPAPGWLIGEQARWLLALFPVLEILPLWWRRAYPRACFVGVAVATGAQAVFVSEPLYGQVAFPIAVYSVARYAGLRFGLLAVGVGLVGAFVAAYRWVGHYYGDAAVGAGPMTSYVVTIAAIVLTAWALGLSLQSRARYVAGLVERAEQAVRAADQQAALAAADERARIARDMHDVVAHGLSVIVVQADGARYAAAADPQAVAPALENIAATGRAALADMRGMLGLLRAESAADARPQPRLTDIADLVAEARAAGAAVEADLPPPSAAVPDGVALTTFRVVQEALSNVRRHAGPGPAVRVRVALDGQRPPAVHVLVEDDGRGAAAHHDGRGLGLVGMRERVALHGGEVLAGPRPGGGFRVTARIPGG